MGTENKTILIVNRVEASMSLPGEPALSEKAQYERQFEDAVSISKLMHAETRLNDDRIPHLIVKIRPKKR